jgi:hypothetical protein
MTGTARADQSRHARLGALRSPGGGAAALPPARWVDRAPPRLLPGHTLAEPEVAHRSDPSAAWSVGLGATDAPDSRSCPPMTPRWSSRGQRRAGKLPEPCARADGGRAPQPDLRRLYTRRVGEPRPWGRGLQSLHLERATRSRRRGGRPAGPRARKDVSRGNRTGKANSESPQGTEADVHRVSPPYHPGQAARPSPPQGPDPCHGCRWTNRHRASGLERAGGPATGPDPGGSSVARSERVETQTGPRRQAPHGDAHGLRSSPPEQHGPGSGRQR